MDTIGERLREERLRNGWSQKDLARESKINVDTISGIETGQHEPRPSTLTKLAKALSIEVRDLFEEPALSGKAEAPREAGPTLLDKALDAVRHDEKKDLHAQARLDASEGTPQPTHSYKEDKFRAVLRARGYPDEDFESFIWPLIVKARRAEQLEQEIARLQEERGQETAMHQDLEIRPE